MIDPATAIAAYEAAKKIIAAVGVAEGAAAKIDTWYHSKPSAKDQERIVAYCKHLNERRVFYVDYGQEAVECCLGSLNEVRQVTLDTKANVAHPAADAFLGAALDSIRGFLDRWSTLRDRRWPEHDRDALDREHRFFTSLGELRARMQTYVALLSTIAPKAIAPNLYTMFTNNDRAT